MLSDKLCKSVKLYKPPEKKPKQIVHEGLATASVEDCPELCPQEELATVTCKKERRPTGKISRLLKITCLEAGMLNSSVDFQETPWLSRVLAELELSISVKAEAGGLHSIVCPALQAQTPVQAAHLDEKLCLVLFYGQAGRSQHVL